VAALALSMLSCLGAGMFSIVRRETSPLGVPTAAVTVVVEPWVPTGTAMPLATPGKGSPSAEEIMARSVAAMSKVTSAHMAFEQEAVGEYEASGEGDISLPDRAHIVKISSYDQEPVDMIVIGATGYWIDESVAGGWNLGPIAPFASNPARWLELLRFYSDAQFVGENMVNGVECYHVQFAVAIESGWLGLFSGGGTGEAWVSTEDHALVKATYDLEYQGSRESGHMLLTLELSDLNVPVSIEAPK